MRVLVLLSGGIDSALVLALGVKAEWECHALAFDYGQPHVIELDAARAVAEHYGVPFEIIELIDVALPKVDDVVFAGRNMVFASLAVAIAQARGFGAVAVGCNGSDWSRFPDCRPAFWHNLRLAAEDAYGVSIRTPLLHNSKIDIVRAAREMDVPIDLTWSCYSPIWNHPCGRCLACETRKAAMDYDQEAKA